MKNWNKRSFKDKIFIIGFTFVILFIDFGYLKWIIKTILNYKYIYNLDLEIQLIIVSLLFIIFINVSGIIKPHIEFFTKVYKSYDNLLLSFALQTKKQLSLKGGRTVKKRQIIKIK